MILCSGSLASASEFSELKARAKSGDVDAQYDLGTFYSNKGGKGRGRTKDNQQAVFWYTKAAEQGLASAQFDLGRMYVTGKGVTQDVEQGVAWQLKAAEQGLASAQFAIGKRYFLGADLIQDYQQALDMFLVAAEQGLVDAQNQLGVMYFKGQGVPQIYVLAHMWMNLAAANGDEKGPKNRDIIAKKMTLSELEHAQKLAREFQAKKE